MKNITVSVDEEVLSTVRQHAAARSTSVNQIVRDYLVQIAQHEDRACKHAGVCALCNRSEAKIGRAAWTREELHERLTVFSTRT